MRWHNHMRMGRPVTEGGIYSARFFIAKTWDCLIMTMHKKKKKSVAWQQCNSGKNNMIPCLFLFAENSKDENNTVNTSLCYWQGEALMWPFSIQCLLNKNIIFCKKTKKLPSIHWRHSLLKTAAKNELWPLDIATRPWYKLWRNLGADTCSPYCATNAALCRDW